MKMIIAVILCCLYTINATHLEKCTPQDGGWSEWLRWGPCNASCGKGKRFRHRFCDNPIPKYGGSGCSGGEPAEHEDCNLGDCPERGTLSETYHYTSCSASCGGGQRTKYKTCVPPSSSTATCYMDCPYHANVTEACNLKKCETEPRDVCNKCIHKAKEFGEEKNIPGFVGHACRVSTAACYRRTNGIRDMYVANDWFFLHCSPDGPWCKPCATRQLVYNPKCGQCEKTRDGKCTGPEEWRNGKTHDVLSDEDLW